MKSLFVSAIFALLLLIGGCQSKNSAQEIRISTNPWIGFTPFMYAEEKGWLKGSKFKFLWIVSLDENAALYEKGLSDGFTATQYEYFNFKEQTYLKPYFFIDRSSGADVILSNKSLSELKDSKEKIECYFELISVNKDIFNAFITENGLDKSKFVLKNSDQAKMAQLQAKNTPMLLISYEPYASNIQKNGFKKISSTKELKSISVIDAIFIDERVMEGNEKEIKHLQEVFNRAVLALKSNPKEYYETIKGYLENQTYEEFINSLNGIEWVDDKEKSQKNKEYLQKQKIPVDKLLV